MQKIFRFLFSIILCAFTLVFVTVNIANACTQNEIDINGDGTNCQTAKFTITTTNLTANTTFKFAMSAMGTFYVDWGNGIVDTINRTDTTETLYSHTYVTAGVKTIRFGGLATGYSTLASMYSDFGSAIRFGKKYYLQVPTNNNDMTPELIDEIDGSLTAIFPRITGKIPRFAFTFADTNIRNIPSNLFSMPKGTATAYMFGGTFKNCKNLISIPATLFNSITSLANDTFRWGFEHCTSLISIPDGLFSTIVSINGAAHFAFEDTFLYCSSLRGYVPPSTFAGLIANGLLYDTYDAGMMHRIFIGTNLATTCPSGTTQYITGYEDYWDGHVSCVDENFVCDMGEYLPAHGYQCEPCPENHYCPSSGTYPYNETISSGATQCPSGLYAPAGMSSVAQCGRILHVGDNVVYLRSVKKTTPSLHIDINNDNVADFFGNMTTLDVPMNINTERKLKIRFNNTTYSVYDDTVDLSLYGNE